MEDKIIRTPEEINEVLNECTDGKENGSQYPGMSYVDGIQSMYDWITGNTNDYPFE